MEPIPKGLLCFGYCLLPEDVWLGKPSSGFGCCFVGQRVGQSTGSDGVRVNLAAEGVQSEHDPNWGTARHTPSRGGDRPQTHPRTPGAQRHQTDAPLHTRQQPNAGKYQKSVRQFEPEKRVGYCRTFCIVGIHNTKSTTEVAYI